MDPQFAFSSLDDAVRQLRVASRAAGADLHPLPYSRFMPGEYTWWLAPTTSNPAYADGKIVVERPSVVEGGAVVIGFHVEKGVGPSAAPMFEDTSRGRSLLLADDWLWQAFLRGMTSGDVEADLIAAEKAADGLPLVVEIVASVQFPPRLATDEDRPVGSVERAWYRPSGGALTLRGRETPELLAALGTQETMATLAEKIRAMPKVDWAWVEVMVGIPFHSVPSGGLSASEVWRRACAPWLRWVR